MSEEQVKMILEQLANHENRLQHLEGSKQRKAVKMTAAAPKRSGKAEDLHLPIQRLVDSGFFDDARIDLDVVSELQKKLLTRKKPLRASVVNVLRSLVRAGVLERTEVVRHERKLIAYVKA